MRLSHVCCILLIAFSAPAESPLTVSLTNLLRSVETHYPSVIAALREREAAEANATSAAGAFDLKLKFNSRNNPVGFYENRILEALVEQPLRYGGAKIYGGWRRGDGLFPLQEEKRETQSAGEVLLGVSAPLLRGSTIDEPRAKIQQAEIGIEYQQAALDGLRLLAQQAAVEQLLRWETAAKRLDAYKALLDFARTRDAGLRQQIEIGEKAAVDAIDNQRLITSRQENLISAEQKLDAEAIKLSIYWRDAKGSPSIPTDLTDAELFGSGLDWTEPRIEEAIARHPQIASLQRHLEAEKVSLELYQNQRLPQLDLSMSLSKDLGIGSKTKENPEFQIGAAFEFPFQNRKASGAAEAASMKLAALNQKLTLVFDLLRAQAQTAEMNIARIRQRIVRLEERKDLTIKMWQVETEKLELKLSDLLRLNLREQDVATAQIALIDAHLELRLAELQRLNALGVDLLNPARPTNSTTIP